MTTRRRKPTAGPMFHVDTLFTYALEQFRPAQARVASLTLRATGSGAVGRIVVRDADDVATVYRLTMDAEGVCSCQREMLDD